MSNKKPDYGIREENEKMLLRIEKIEKKYEKIDNANWILKSDPVLVRDTIDDYIEELTDAIARFYNSDDMVAVTLQAHEDFISSMRDFRDQIDINPETTKIVTDQAIDSINDNVEKLVSDTHNNLITKSATLRQNVQADLEELSRQALESIEQAGKKTRSIASRTVLGVDYSNLTDEQQAIVDKQWGELTKKYGKSDTVRFRDGANYPLRPYLDGRSITTANEIYRKTNALDATSSGILTGKVSNHGQCCDSCLKWQDKIVFYTEGGKKAMTAEFPQMSKVPTLADLESNSDHIFKFNCLHYLRSWPIQFFDKKDQLQAIRAGI